jgi:heme-degrading monooxygenase HmoA
MSLVLAADYRVPDFDHWWAGLTRDVRRLPGLGAHHIVVYRSIEDASRVFVTIGFRERRPVDALLRSPVMFSWFDAAGVEEFPPMFVGEVVEKLDLGSPDGSAAQDSGTGPAASAGTVMVAAIAPVGELEEMRDRVHAAADRIAASGVRRFWIYRAVDDQAEVMILLQIATEQQAEEWIRHPDAAAAFMSEAGEGAYPPLFVGHLVQAIEVPQDSASPGGDETLIPPEPPRG